MPGPVTACSAACELATDATIAVGPACPFLASASAAAEAAVCTATQCAAEDMSASGTASLFLASASAAGEGVSVPAATGGCLPLIMTYEPKL